MTPWKHADDWPVERGQVWTVGPTLIFACADLVEDDLADRLIERHGPVDLMYADPPWTTGQANQFRSLGGLDRAPYEASAIYDSVLDLLATDWWLITDRDPLHQAHVLDALSHHRQTWRLQGFSTPSVLAYLHYASPVPVIPGDLTDVKDQHLPDRILDAYPEPGVCMDPCSGLGILSRAAWRHGWTCLSHELDPHRVSAALTRTAKIAGIEPSLSTTCA